MRDKQFVVYILSNPKKLLYVGVSSDIKKRIWEHKNHLKAEFTSRYDITELMYLEPMPNALSAFARETQIKTWRRQKKIVLIEQNNPSWQDLSKDWYPDRKIRLSTIDV